MTNDLYNFAAALVHSTHLEITNETHRMQLRVTERPMETII